jgi:TetR/AcrR family tetracycline transcriptional repressor
VAPQRSPGQRAGLNHAQVLAAARDLLVERGLAALTMRGLAQRLAVSPNALYSHVENKTSLIDEVLDDVLAQVCAPDTDAATPADGLQALMASAHDVLLAHPDLVPLYLARQGARGPNAQHLGDIVLNLLARADVTGPRAREALRVLIVYTIGFAAFSTRADESSRTEPDPSSHELAENFDSGLRWLLAGITTPR